MGRTKLNRTNLHARVDPATLEVLKQAAKRLGFIYTDNSGNKEGSVGKLLDAIARDFVLFSRLEKKSGFLVDSFCGDN